MKTSFKLVIEAYACDEFGDGPAFAELEMDQSFLAELQRLKEICLEHDLEIVRVNRGPDAWDNQDDLRIRGSSLDVSNDSFWFLGYPKYVDYHVETRMIMIDDLVRMSATDSDDPELPNFRWHEGRLFYAGDPGFLDDLVEMQDADDAGNAVRAERIECQGCGLPTSVDADRNCNACHDRQEAAVAPA